MTGARLALAALAFAASACSTTHEVRRLGLPEGLGWLREGSSSRAEIVARLGEPSSRFEAGRIEAWQLTESGARRPPPEWNGSRAPARSLVIVFGEGERALRVALVQLW